VVTNAQEQKARSSDTAIAIVNKAIEYLGGEKYLQVNSQVSRGKFSLIRGNALVSFQSFLDVIVFPNRERTEFKSMGSRTIQVNSGDTGWVFDGDQSSIKEQNEKQVASFRQSIRTSLDNVLRGYWKGKADLTYVGKRPATLGKRNDVVKLTYHDGFIVEFEFAVDDGRPQKALYKRTGGDNEEIKEEDRYAQFIEVGGVMAPFVVDRFTDGTQSSRINLEKIEFNKTIPDSIFNKPATPKEAKKDIKL
jgi:hypothetical protein